jgi:hypothetical protein
MHELGDPSKVRAALKPMFCGRDVCRHSSAETDALYRHLGVILRSLVETAEGFQLTALGRQQLAG